MTSRRGILCLALLALSAAGCSDDDKQGETFTGSCSFAQVGAFVDVTVTLRSNAAAGGSLAPWFEYTHGDSEPTKVGLQAPMPPHGMALVDDVSTVAVVANNDAAAIDGESCGLSSEYSAVALKAYSTNASGDGVLPGDQGILLILPISGLNGPQVVELKAEPA